MTSNTDQFEESRLAIAKTEVFDDFNYGEIWDAAELRLRERVDQYVQHNGRIDEVTFTMFFKEAASEVLMAVGNDLDIDVDDHINVTATSEKGKGMKVAVQPISSIGDIFCLLYDSENHEIV